MSNSRIKTNMNPLQDAVMTGVFAAPITAPMQSEDGNIFTTSINIGYEHTTTAGAEPMWYSQIEVHGSTPEDADALRDFILRCIHEKLDSITFEEWRKL